MKVIHVLNHFLPQQTAGTEVYAWALSKALLELNYDIQVLIPNYGSTTNETYTYDGISVIKFSDPTTIDRQLMLGQKHSLGIDSFNRILELERPDIIHFHEIGSGNGVTLDHLITAKNHGLKVLVTFHLAGYSCMTGGLINSKNQICEGKYDLHDCTKCALSKKGIKIGNSFLSGVSVLLRKSEISTLRWNNKVGTLLGTSEIIHSHNTRLHQIIKFSDRVVTLTDWYKDVLIKNRVEENKIRTVYQGLSSYEKLELKSKKNNQTLNLVYVGRITEIKGIHILIKAVESIKDKEITLSIYGEDDNTNYGAELRLKTKSNINISWKGKIPTNRVRDEISKYNLLCLCTTITEMSPLVFLEARSVGVPIIASNVLGNRKLIEDKINGFLFDFNNYKSLRNKLLEIFNNPRLLKQVNVFEEEIRTFKDVALEYSKIYGEL